LKIEFYYDSIFTTMPIVTIPKNITGNEELVVLPRREFERILDMKKNNGKVTERAILQWSLEAKKMKKEKKLPVLHSLRDLR
jgi:hypothetical protein